MGFGRHAGRILSLKDVYDKSKDILRKNLRKRFKVKNTKMKMTPVTKS